MRSSDWSSDVCSSDLLIKARKRAHQHRPATIEAAAVSHLPYIPYPACILSHEEVAKSFICAVHRLGMPFEAGFPPTGSAVLRRPEERRVGKECVSAGRYGWWPPH